MTPSIKNILKKHVDLDSKNRILKLLESCGYDLSIARDSKLILDVLEYCDFEEQKIEAFLLKLTAERQEEKLSDFRKWIVIARFYGRENQGYYQKFGGLLACSANKLRTFELKFCLSHNTVCCLSPEDQEFNPLAYVVPLVNGEVFLTQHKGANFLHKLPRLSKEIPGILVGEENFTIEVNRFLKSIVSASQKTRENK